MQMPPQFEEIARLSDIALAESALAVTSQSNPELTREVIAIVKAEYESGNPRALYSALMALSVELFKELTGWVLFGRDYSPDQGETVMMTGRLRGMGREAECTVSAVKVSLPQLNI